MAGMKVIEIEDVCFGYEHQEVLHNITLTLEEGQFAVMVGPNGGGKTTLLRLMLGLLTPRYGWIRILGQKPEQARRQVGYVPQSMHYDAQFPASVEDVVLMGRVERHWFGPYRQTDRQAAQTALARVGLDGFGRRPFRALSGGERQRVLIARSLASGPRLLLLDEPGANLDPSSGRQVYDLLRDLNRQVTILLVSHNLKVVASYVSHVICVNRTADMHRISDVARTLVDGDEWIQLNHVGCPVAAGGDVCSTPHHGAPAGASWCPCGHPRSGGQA
ncbi:MAG: ABC transporter ATP-binding protein [Lentisphaeria bacterium]|nr:ABC transporter ATP-binding protein [Lentisphaeria bacterium]